MTSRASILAFLANDASAARDVAPLVERDFAQARRVDARGCGTGWIVDARALVQRRPDLTLSPALLAESMGAQPSRVVLACSAHPSMRTRSTDLPPFRLGGWLAGVSCTPRAAWDADTLRHLSSLVPDPVLRSFEGESAGELLASVVLGALWRRGLLQAPAPDPSDVVDVAVHALLAAADRLRSKRPPVDLVLTNSRFVFCVAGSGPGAVRLRRGFVPAPDPLAFARPERPAWRGAAVVLGPAAEPLLDAPDWEPIREGEWRLVELDGSVRTGVVGG